MPEGFNLNTIPNDLFNVLEHSLRILAWQENLSSEECPPSWMWHLDWEISDWFEKVKIERDRKYGTNKSKSATYDDAEEPEGLFEENLYFEQMKRGEPLFE